MTDEREISPAERAAEAGLEARRLYQETDDALRGLLDAHEYRIRAEQRFFEAKVKHDQAVHDLYLFAAAVIQRAQTEAHGDA